MFYKSDRNMVTLLMNVYAHLKDDYDYLLVICGDTGTGKSIGIGLNLIETWYKIILGQKFDKSRHKHITGNYEQWLKNFKDFDAYDLNIFDEGASALESKDFMNRISRDITKVFNVFRGKRFFSVIIIPSFFHLNKYFRETRLRGCIYVSRRGVYNYYSKKGLSYLNAYNQNKQFKSMSRARPFYKKSFPDYKGVMLKPYLAEKEAYMNEVLDYKPEVVNNRDGFRYYDLYADKLIPFFKKKVKYDVIMKKYPNLDKHNITRVKQQLIKNNLL